MQRENIVSLWLGHFTSQSSFSSYIKEVYSDFGNVSSIFMESFHIQFIDNQFQETYYTSKVGSKEELLVGLSYDESYIDSIEIVDWSLYNSVIALYNFKYTGHVKSDGNMQFIGFYPYQ